MSNTNFLLSGATLTAGTTTTYELEADVGESVFFDVTVESISGSPTAASITVKNQVAPIEWNGVSLDGETSGALIPWQDVVYGDGYTGHLLIDGAWPASLADQTLVASRIVTRRILTSANARLHRLSIATTFTGGTSPSFKVTVVAGVASNQYINY